MLKRLQERYGIQPGNEVYMQRIGSIVKQLNKRRNMENLETFECSHKIAYPSRDGGGKYSIYVTKEDGTDTVSYTHLTLPTILLV